MSFWTWAGAGLIGILAARRGHRVVATDVVPTYTECLRANALLNGVGSRLEARIGDLFEPVTAETFDVIASACPPTTWLRNSAVFSSLGTFPSSLAMSFWTWGRGPA